MGVYSTYDAYSDTENMALVDATVIDKIFDVVANLIQALRTVVEFERVVYNLLNNIVLQVGDNECHTVTTDVDSGKIYRCVR